MENVSVNITVIRKDVTVNISPVKENVMVSVKSPLSVREYREQWISSGVNYIGKALAGSSELDPVWVIYKIAVSAAGTVTSQSAYNVRWADRLTIIYT